MTGQKWKGFQSTLIPAEVAEIAFLPLTADVIERGLHVSVDFHLADPGRYDKENRMPTRYYGELA